MGQQERELQKRTRKGQIERILLEMVKIAGVLSVALVAPNAVQSLRKLGILPYPRQKEVIKNTRRKLIEKGLLINKDGALELSEEGEKKLALLHMDHNLPKPKQWDKKWRLLVFDIKEQRRGTRDKIRHTLQSLGFERLQNSVWLYPYDCEDLVVLLKADLKVGKEMLYMIVDSLENDKMWREKFGLH